MAANYKVNIELDTKKLDKQLRDLGVKVDKVGKVKQSQSKKTIADGDKEVKQELQKIRLKNESLGIETQVKKIKSKILDINKVENNIEEATLRASKGEFDLAKKGNLLAKQAVLETRKELAAEKKVTAEKVKQVNLQSAGMNLIRLSGRAGKLGGRAAAVIDQQTALRQPKGLPSASMLNAEARGIKRLIPERLTDAGNIRGEGYIASSAEKAARFEERINKARKRGIENNKDLVGSERLRNRQLLRSIKATEQAANAEARRLNQALRNPLGPSSPLNYRGNQLLPGPAGSGRGGGLTSALISGAFPLLFGQGPLAAAGGFTGGLVGDRLGGQMGGFAGGLIGTAVVTGIQNFSVSVGKLGAALSDATKDIEAVTAALGVTGTEFEKNLRTLQKLGGEEAAFDAARQRMITLVGQDGVDALTSFGDGMTKLGNDFQIVMTQIRASFAGFLQGSGIGGFLARRVERTALLGQAQVSDNKNIQNLIGIRDRLKDSFALPGQKERLAKTVLGLERNPLFITQVDIENAIAKINDLIVKNQKGLNDAERKAALEKLQADIQKQRVKNITDEIALLERSFGMTSDEFEIEKQIMQMKQDGEIKDEAEIRNKLKHLQNLQKERQLAEETAAAFERMSQTIATDISQGIQGMIRGTSTLNDLLNNVLNKLIDAAFNMAFFGNPQGTLGGGGLFGSIFSGIGSIFSMSNPFNSVGDPALTGAFSGSGSSIPFFVPDTPLVPQLANGGSAKGGKSYLVGERGPELFTPGVSGMVTPNHALGGSTNIVVNVDASGSSVEGDEEQGRELGRMISVAIQSELIQQKRPGGLLA